MPVAPVGDRVSLYYEDSGAPDGAASYTTFVLVHGGGFHGAIFRRMLPFAAARGLRVVTPNLRGYPGSTPYSAEELDAFDGPDVDAQAAALRSHGDEIAAFLAWLIESAHLPAIQRAASGSAESVTGGIVLLGWSAGNAATLSMVANAAALPDATRTLLEAHLRTLVVFDPPTIALGFAPPPRLYSPLRDAALAPAARIAVLARWVSTYYAPAEPHPARARDAADSAPLRAPPPSTARMSAAEHAAAADTGALRAHLRVVGARPAVLRASVARALALDGGAPCWPALDVRAVWCAHSVGDTVYAVWALERLCEASPGARAGRLPRTEFVKMEGANHFVTWDEPERAVSFLVSII